MVFWPALAIAAGFILWGAVSPDSLAATSGAALSAIISGFGWGFVVSTAFFLIFSVFLAVTRFGRIKLGRDDEAPGVHHPFLGLHDVQRRHGHRADVLGRGRAGVPLRRASARLAEPQSREAALIAMKYSYFHWALHPWAIYAVVGLAIAYFTYRKGGPS
jgi:choline-glycine betaine transporter